jgi:hypothetical protein
MTYKRLLVGLLAAFLTGCSTVKYVRELPPVELLRDCPVVVEQYKTNGQLALTLLEYRKALAQCNIDKESLREWAKP